MGPMTREMVTSTVRGSPLSIAPTASSVRWAWAPMTPTSASVRPIADFPGKARHPNRRVIHPQMAAMAVDQRDYVGGAAFTHWARSITRQRCTRGRGGLSP